MEAVIKGVLAGLAYGLLLGPLFFICLQVTLSKGIRNGLAVVLGAFISDVTLASAGWWSAERLAAMARADFFQSGVGLLGALLIIGFGISAVIPHKHEVSDILVAGVAKRRYSLLKGFVLNTANPSNWLFWLGLAVAAGAEAPAGADYYTLVFLGAALAMVLGTDVAKVFLAGQIGRRLRPDIPGKIVRLAGVVLILVGVWIVIKISWAAF